MSLKTIHPTPQRAFTPIRSQRSIRSIKCSISASSSTPNNLITLTIKKPLGLVLAESPQGKVFVEEILPGGNADATKQVQVGDIVVKTSAIVLKSSDKSGQYEREGYGQRVYDNWETIEFDCTDQTFDTVMAAIGSNNERWGIKTVTLSLMRP